MISPRAERALVTDWWMTVDRTFLGLALLLGACGVVASLVASPQIAIHYKLDPNHFVIRHAIALSFAFSIIVGVSFLEPRRIRQIALGIFAVSMLLMIAVLFQGMERNGASRWIFAAGLNLQPSEFAKPAFVVLVSWLFAESLKRRDMPALEFASALLVTMLVLLILEPDVGQAVLVALVWITLFFLSGYSLRLAPIFLFLLALGLVAAYVSLPHFASRIDRFVGGAGDLRQMNAAARAFTDAGWFGRGLGEGFVKGRLPDAHNDYVFAAVAEELGIAACLALACLYALIVLKGLAASFREEDAFARLAVAGLITMFGLQALINMAVNLNLLPSKGVTLPLISYGRSSLLSCAMTLGMVLALTRRSRQDQTGGETASFNFSFEEVKGAHHSAMSNGHLGGFAAGERSRM